jgi:hypothetical protein
MGAHLVALNLRQFGGLLVGTIAIQVGFLNLSDALAGSTVVWAVLLVSVTLLSFGVGRRYGQ